MSINSDFAFLVFFLKHWFSKEIENETFLLDLESFLDLKGLESDTQMKEVRDGFMQPARHIRSSRPFRGFAS